MKHYQGLTGGYVAVVVDGKSYPLNPRLDLIDYGQEGTSRFGWGHHGAGPSQLALAILADFTFDDTFARTHHMAFKRKCIGLLPSLRAFTVDADEVGSFVSAVPKNAD